MDGVLAALSVGGHLLLEGAPGVAKSLARLRGRQGLWHDVAPAAVHPGHASLGRHRDPHTSRRRACLQARTCVHQHPSRRRDQQDAAEDSGGPARSDAGGSGQRRRSAARPSAAVHRARHSEPDRVRGDVPAARSTARPLLHEARRWLPAAGRRRGFAAHEAFGCPPLDARRRRRRGVRRGCAGGPGGGGLRSR